MSKKEDLKEKLCKKPIPRNFTTKELDALMSKCNCEKYSGGRGSSLRYIHKPTQRVLTFDGPHPGNELYSYQIKKVKTFLEQIGEVVEVEQ